MFLVKGTSARAHAVVARHEGVAVRTFQVDELEDQMPSMRGGLSSLENRSRRCNGQVFVGSCSVVEGRLNVRQAQLRQSC